MGFCSIFRFLAGGRLFISMNYTYSDSAHQTASDYVKKSAKKICSNFALRQLYNKGKIK
jgi:hypothetical protein